MKIAIEGMDGVGKSTISKMLADKYGFLYLEKPLTEVMDTRLVNGKDNLSAISNNIYNFDDEIIKAWFFGMGNLYSFLKYKNTDLIIDRHFASNYFWNGSPRSNVIFNSMIELIGVPDITIVLYASVETRISRLYKRDENDADLKDSEKHVLGYDKMIKFLDDFSIPYVVVDTDNKNIEQVFEEVDRIVNSLVSAKVKKLVK